MYKLHQALQNAFSDARELDELISVGSNEFIKVRREKVTFKMQSGPVSDFGLNGVQCEELLKFVKSYLEILDTERSSAHNKKAMWHITEALAALEFRTKDRIKRGVEGTDKD